jgi:hypothetical protein
MLVPFPPAVADALACLVRGLQVRLERGELTLLEPVTFEDGVAFPFEQATRIVLAEYEHHLERGRDYRESPTEEQQAALLDQLRELCIRAVMAKV